MDEELKGVHLSPLIHKWFARRRPESVKVAFDALLSALGGSKQLTVLDPFCGSGSLLLEAKRRGHNFVGVDINPVAALIADYSLHPVSAEDLESALGEIDAEVGQPIRMAYSSRTNGRVAERVTCFHSRLVVCHCGAEVELHHSWLLARHEEAGWGAYICRACKSVFIAGTTERVECPDCGDEFSWSEGTVRNNIVRCTECLMETPLLDLPSVGEKPRHKVVAVEVFENGRRFFRGPTRKDAARADGRLAGMNGGVADSLRGVSIPADKRFDPRPISHGFKTYGDLFTSAQLWALGLITERIREWPDERMRGALALALSDAAGSNNLLCRYAADWLKLTPAFGLHGYHPVSRPVEGNVWGAPRGRGSFKNCVRKAARAYGALNELPNGGTGTIGRGDAAKLELPDSSVDAVFTDPPYFDYLDYSDLSDFYYQWLRLSLPTHEWFSAPSVRAVGDLSTMRGEEDESFAEGLGAAFKECLRVLKPGGPIVFSYHHSSAQGWLYLLQALQDAGLAVSECKFVTSELNNGFHSAPGNIKSDAILVCRERKRGQRKPSLPTVHIERGADNRMATYALATARLSWSSSRSELEDMQEAARAIR